jgi:hypothetical protein
MGKRHYHTTKFNKNNNTIVGLSVVFYSFTFISKAVSKTMEVKEGIVRTDPNMN